MQSNSSGSIKRTRSHIVFNVVEQKVLIPPFITNVFPDPPYWLIFLPPVSTPHELKMLTPLRFLSLVTSIFLYPVCQKPNIFMPYLLGAWNQQARTTVPLSFSRKTLASIGTDFFYSQSVDYLLVVDHFSCFVEVAALT